MAHTLALLSEYDSVYIGVIAPQNHRAASYKLSRMGQFLDHLIAVLILHEGVYTIVFHPYYLLSP